MHDSLMYGKFPVKYTFGIYSKERDTNKILMIFKKQKRKPCTTMNGENQQLVTDEPVEFEK